MEAWNNNKNFYDILKNDETLLKHISKQELKDIMKDDTKKNQIDWIFKNKIK